MDYHVILVIISCIRSSDLLTLQCWSKIPILGGTEGGGRQWSGQSRSTRLDDNWVWCWQTICIIGARVCALASMMHISLLLWNTCLILLYFHPDVASFSIQVMHGEDYVCLGFLFGRKARVAYLSDVSRILLRTEQGRNIVSPSFFIQLTESFFIVCMIVYTS
jgi:hypothetical protein